MNKPTPMEEGRLAAAQGEPRSANPYDPDSKEYADWLEGYEHFKDVDEEGELTEDA